MKKELPIPEFIFEVMRYDEEIELLTEFLFDSISSHSLINPSFFIKYPELLNVFSSGVSREEIHALCHSQLKQRYFNNLEELSEKIDYFKKDWDKKNNKLLLSLSREFETVWNYHHITVKVGNVPLCPRWISDPSFYVPSYIDDFSSIALHECCHFIFFQKLMSINSEYSLKDFEYPTPEWILSEALIEPIIGKSLYQDMIHTKVTSYPEFYSIFIDNKNVVKHLDILYNGNGSTEERIMACLRFISAHQNEIICSL